VRATLLACALLLALPGCHSVGRRDGACCNRPRLMDCDCCSSLIQDPIGFGHECDRGPCTPPMPGRLWMTVRHNQDGLPPVGCVTGVRAPADVGSTWWSSGAPSPIVVK
jgi:hypothetical protein